MPQIPSGMMAMSGSRRCQDREKPDRIGCLKGAQNRLRILSGLEYCLKKGQIRE